MALSTVIRPAVPPAEKTVADIFIRHIIHRDRESMLLIPNSARADEWLAEHAPGAERLCGASIVEFGQGFRLLQVMAGDGLVLR